MKLRFVHIFGLAAILIIAHIGALSAGLYKGKIWIDMPLHFGGGVFFALVAIWIIQKIKLNGFHKIFPFFVITSFALMGSFLWEVFEILLWKTMPKQADMLKIYPTTMSDVISDLTFGLLGGITVSVIYIIFVIIKKPKN